jgi:hypothetical protein
MMLRRFSLVIIVIVFATTLRAATPDPLWTAAVDHAVKSRNLVATTITTRTEIRDGDSKVLEIVKDNDRLTGWNGSEPQRKKETTREVVKKAGISIEMRVRANGNVFLASREGRVTMRFVRNETVSGRSCAVYHYDERPATAGGDNYSGEAWIERETGRPVQVSYTIKPLPAHCTAFKATVSYETRPDGLFVIKRLVSDMAGGQFFIKRQVHIEKDFTGWTAPPA